MGVFENPTNLQQSGLHSLHVEDVGSSALGGITGLVLGMSSSVQPAFAGDEDNGLYRLLKGGSLTAANNINNGYNGVHRANLSSASVDGLFQGGFLLGALILILTANKTS